MPHQEEITINGAINMLRANLKLRPIWMNGLMLFCVYMAVIYVPWDIFLKPVAEDQEVWFGYMFTGWAAKATAVLHWFVYAAGSIGFWKMRPWMFPWASLYVVQIAIGMFVWNLLYGGGGLASSLIISLVFMALAIALWRARGLFEKSNQLNL